MSGVTAQFRPPLYGARPLGLGTPLVESLIGLFARLCRARHVLARDVLDALVRPLVPPGTLLPYCELPRFLSQQAARLDGMQAQSAAFAGALERLTGLSDLDLHTFLPWAALSPPAHSGAVAPRSARWCARCFEDWHRAGVDPWEPLLWRSRLASHCPHHRVPLSSRCPACGASSSVVSDRVPLGVCGRCGRLLSCGDPNLRAVLPSLRSAPEDRFAWWVSLALGQMLSVQSRARAGIDVGGFARLIRRCAAAPGVGIQPLARYLGVSHRTLVHWRDGACKPRLRWYLRVCIRLGASPAQIALGSGAFHTPWREPMSRWRERAVTGTAQIRDNEARWTRLSRAIDRSIASGGPRSVRDFARKQGVHFTIIGRRFPQRYATLVAQAAANRARERRAFESECARALDAALAGSRPRSALSVAQALKITSGRLQRTCPDRYARLVAVYAERAAHARSDRLRSRCQAVRASVHRLLSTDVHPSLWRAVTCAGLPEALCGHPSIREAWRAAVRHLGVSSSFPSALSVGPSIDAVQRRAPPSGLDLRARLPVSGAPLRVRR